MQNFIKRQVLGKRPKPTPDLSPEQERLEPFRPTGVKPELFQARVKAIKRLYIPENETSTQTDGPGTPTWSEAEALSRNVAKSLAKPSPAQESKEPESQQPKSEVSNDHFLEVPSSLTTEQVRALPDLDPVLEEDDSQEKGGEENA